MVAVLMVIYIGILALVHPASAPRVKTNVTWAERLKALKDVCAAIVLVLLVLGSIYLGVATPTEAAGLGAVGAFAVATLYRQLDLPTFFDIIRSTVVTSGMILLILAAALLFGWVITQPDDSPTVGDVDRRHGRSRLDDILDDPTVPCSDRHVS